MLIDLLKQIREKPEVFRQAIKNRQATVDVDKILALDKEWRSLTSEAEFLRAEQNRISKNKKFSQDELEKAKSIKERIKELEKELGPLEKELEQLLYLVPNVPLPDVPVGLDETGNKALREVGKKPKFSFKPKDYLEIGEKLDIIDTERAAKVSGTRFGYLKGEAVLIEFALIKLAFETLLKEGFTLIVPPVMLKPEMMEGTGHLTGADKNEKYFIEKDELYLAGSAEQPIVAMHANEIFNEKDLPKRYLGFSSCFRREAGSYGKDTKGIFRVHQFDKVEMFSFCGVEDSIKEHKFFLSMQEKLMKLLKIPYRVVHICTGDLAFPAANAYDIEAWIPSENRYRETHTTFNDTDFQTRRLNIRYKSKNGLKFTHALNGTAFAIGRTIIAIIENYQQKDGSIEIPKVLKKYL